MVEAASSKHQSFCCFVAAVTAFDETGADRGGYRVLDRGDIHFYAIYKGPDWRILIFFKKTIQFIGVIPIRME